LEARCHNKDAHDHSQGAKVGGRTQVTPAKVVEDTRSIEELLSFVEDSGPSQQANSKKQPRQKKPDATQSIDSGVVAGKSEAKLQGEAVKSAVIEDGVGGVRADPCMPKKPAKKKKQSKKK